MVGKNGLFLRTLAFSLVAAVWSAAAAHASGFGIFTQGAEALGRANAAVASGDGPSVLFFNPALMNRLEGTRLEAGTTLIFPRREFRDDNGASSTTRDSVFYPSTFYLTHAINEKASVGLAVFNPFGLGTDWGGEWPGRYIATKSEIESYAINPAVSYRMAPWLSVAAGLDVVLLDAKLEGRIFTPAGDVRQRFKGDGSGIGYNVAIALGAGRGITLGASYRSEVRIDIDGRAAFDLPAGLPAGLFPATAARTSITLPQQVSAAIAGRVGDDLTVEVGMRWEDWSSFNQLKIDFEQPVAGTSTAISPRDWQATFAVNAGGKYRISDRYSVMAGYLYGWNPVPDSSFEPAIPDSNTHLLCIGGEGRFDRLTIALGYGYQLQEGRTKNNSIGTFPGSNPTDLVNGRYSSDLHLLGMSFGYRF
jgi:long-chain fatty acid transport protein